LLPEDVEAHVKTGGAKPAPAAAPATAPAAAMSIPAIPTAGALNVPDEERSQKRVPMTRMRARIAERLLYAKSSTAMLTTFNEVDMQPFIELRKKHKDQFEKSHGVRLGFMSIFIKAAAEALKRFPDVNASIDGNDIVYHNFCDIGVAVSSDRGLVVPILRNAEQQSLAELEANVSDFGKRARDGKIGMEEMTGGTFTISNGGVFGSLLSTPILNPPQSAILGMHATKERPVVVNGEVVVRPMMYLALSYDHRIIDGQGAVTFLKTICELVEDPAKILLDI
ncbi:MAG: dihydrolipoyllysine-residue succinyltransferase, partial [Granulosicoccaceae bacterium]